MLFRSEQHRKNPACIGCHGVMDPLGFALENFDAVGAWRDRDQETATLIDASGRLGDGRKVNGPVELRDALLTDAPQFVQTLTAKLLGYALGRGVEYYDMPVVRQIVRDAKRQNYRFSAILAGIATSEPFRFSTAPGAENSIDTQAAAVQ